MPRPPATVAIVEDHALVRDGLVRSLMRRADLTLAYVGESTRDVLALDPAPDLVLLDIDLADGPAPLEDVEEIIDKGSRVLVVSAMAEPTIVRRMIRAGVAGLVPKRESSETMFEAIDAVLSGEPWTPPDLAAILVSDPDPTCPTLTDTERRTLTLYASGLKLVSVARQLGISPHTAKEHIDRVRQKYAEVGRPAPTKTDLYRLAVQDGIIDD